MRTTAIPALPARTAPARTGGFTLLELMLVVTVAGVILGLGIPNMAQFIRNNRMTSAANDLLAAAHLARTESVKRREWTVVCFTADPDEAVPSCDGEVSETGQGWVVFVDPDTDLTAASENDVLLRHAPLENSLRLLEPAVTEGYVAYAGSGFARPLAAGAPFDDIVICDPRGNVAVYGDQNSAARAVRIFPTGRPQVTRAVGDITTLGGC